MWALPTRPPLRGAFSEPLLFQPLASQELAAAGQQASSSLRGVGRQEMNEQAQSSRVPPSGQPPQALLAWPAAVIQRQEASQCWGISKVCIPSGAYPTRIHYSGFSLPRGRESEGMPAIQRRLLLPLVKDVGRGRGACACVQTHTPPPHTCSRPCRAGNETPLPGTCFPPQRVCLEVIV